MSWTRWSVLFALAPLSLAVRSVEPDPAAPGFQVTTSRASGGTIAASSGLVTLLAHDDLLSSFSFSNGGQSTSVRSGEVILGDAQLIFHRLSANQLSFGFNRKQRVEVLDLGELVVDPVNRPTDDVTKPPISVFHTLFLEGSVFYHRGPNDDLHRLSGYGNFANGPMPEGIQHIDPQVGHVYLIRYKDEVARGGRDALGKFQVVEFVPDTRLTLRWANL